MDWVTHALEQLGTAALAANERVLIAEQLLDVARQDHTDAKVRLEEIEHATDALRRLLNPDRRQELPL